MGFFDSLGEAVGGAIKSGSEKAYKMKEEMDDALADAREWDDERLIREYKKATNTARKAAYAKELRNRGYGNRDD